MYKTQMYIHRCKSKIYTVQNRLYENFMVVDYENNI